MVTSVVEPSFTLGQMYKKILAEFAGSYRSWGARLIAAITLTFVLIDMYPPTRSS